MLWHRRLVHISIERIMRLVNEGVLSTLDFADFETCVNCIEGKQTNKSKNDAKRSTNLLEIIHTKIYSPNMDANKWSEILYHLHRRLFMIYVTLNTSFQV